MDNSPDTPSEPKPRLTREYEDPHYHDEDEIAPVEDGEHRPTKPAGNRKPARRIPPPRRFRDD
jgi:hypothetical protein